MDGWTFETRFELGAAKLATDSFLAKNAHQTEFVSRQKWQNSSKKVIIIFLFINKMYINLVPMYDTHQKLSIRLLNWYIQSVNFSLDMWYVFI